VRSTTQALLLGAALVATACPVAVAPIDGLEFSCEQDSDCLEGDSCIASRCVGPDQDAGQIGSDSGGGDAADAAQLDAAAIDAIQLDSAVVDAMVSDTSLADSATPDTSLADSATPDTSLADSATPDTSLPDGATPDTSLPDGATPDTSLPDSATPDTSVPADWWDGNWHRRRKLRFDNLAQGESLSDFPVLVFLTASRIDYTATLMGGDDLRFVDADGQSELAYEIESWSSGGASFIWLKVPQIDGASDQDFVWMYHGNSAAGPLGREAEVWSNGYEAVYHLGSDVEDSSPSGFHGSNHGATPSLGVIAGGHSFDGSDDYIDLGTDRDLLRNTTVCTLSAWVEPSSVSGAHHTISISANAGGPTSSSRALLNVMDSEVEGGGRAGDWEGWIGYVSSGAGLLPGGRYNLSTVIDYANDRVHFYIDGAHFQSGDAYFSDRRTSNTSATSNALGAQDDGSGHFFAGHMDEARVSRGQRSADWIAAQHQSMADLDFVIYEADETL